MYFILQLGWLCQETGCIRNEQKVASPAWVNAFFCLFHFIKQSMCPDSQGYSPQLDKNRDRTGLPPRKHRHTYCSFQQVIRLNYEQQKQVSVPPYLLLCTLSCHLACTTRCPELHSRGFLPSNSGMSNSSCCPTLRNFPFLITGGLLVDPLPGLQCFFQDLHMELIQAKVLQMFF